MKPCAEYLHVIISFVVLWTVVLYLVTNTNNNADTTPRFWAVKNQSNRTQGGPVKFFARSRPDGPGREILNYFTIEAYAHWRGGVYGGCCREGEDAIVNDFDRFNIQRTRKLLKQLGLSSSFKDACPTQQDLDEGHSVWITRLEMKDREIASQMFTEEWLASLRARLTIQHATKQSESGGLAMQALEKKEKEGNTPVEKKIFRIVVHVRRGDVTVCVHRLRYLPNAFYLAVLDDYIPKECDTKYNCQVTIVSEAFEADTSSESLEDFVERGYELFLDADIKDAWEKFVQADILVLSPSAFSYVPAFLNGNGSVILPDGSDALAPLPGWTVLSKDSPHMQYGEMIRKEMTKEMCSNGSKN